MKNVIFDLGNVLINFDLNIFYSRINEACDIPLAEIEAEYISEKLEALEIGAISMDRYCKIFRFEWDLKWSPDDWANQYAKCYSPNFYGQELVDRCKAGGYTVSIFSNLADFHKVGIDRTYPGFFSKFDHVFCSYKMGVAKPDRASYAHVCSALNASPSECIFFDDKPENIEGALAVGMKGIVFNEENNPAIEAALFSGL